MQQVKEHLQQKQMEFAQHPFFNAIKHNQSIEPFAQFVPKVAFWVFAFQDVLRINEAKIQDPYYYKIARHHRLEDKGHDQWYLHDLHYFYGPNYFTISWLFSKEQQIARDVSYTLLAEAEKLDDDLLRVVLLLALEASGHIFFEEAANHVNDMGYRNQLQYFDQTHLAIEHAHELFEEEMERQLYEKILEPDRRYRAYRLIDTSFDAFSRILMQYFDDEQAKHLAQGLQHA